MAREDDREYWRRQDENREYWRDQDRRDDRRRDEQRRGEEVQEAWRSLRRGDTAWALRNMVGPDAALEYLRMTGSSDAGADEERAEPEPTEAAWPKHVFVETLVELMANIVSAPRATFEVSAPDKDGDVLVRAVTGTSILDSPLGALWTDMRGGVPYRADHGRFWVRASLLANLGEVRAALERTAALVRDLSTA